MAVDESTFKQFSPFVQNIYEPKKTNRFMLHFSRIPSMGADNKIDDTVKEDELLVALSEAKRPVFKVTPEAISRFHMQYFTAGKVDYETEMKCVFWDYIDNSPSTTISQSATTTDGKTVTTTTPAVLSAGTIIYNWYNSIFNVATGSMGFKTTYVTDATLYILDPQGKPVESWKYFNIYPKDVALGDVSFGDAKNLKIDVTFKFDKVKLVETSDTTKNASAAGTAYNSGIGV